MYAFLFTSLAFACAGGICALAGDMQKRTYLGLACFLLVNAIIWARFVYHLFSPMDLANAAGLFILSHAVSTCAYLGTVYYLGMSGETASGEVLVSRE